MEKLQRLSGIFAPRPKYDAVTGTHSTGDLNEGFGKKFMMTYATQDGIPLFDGQGVNLASCWLEVTVNGLQIIDGQEKPLLSFQISLIPNYKVSPADAAPTFIFTYEIKGKLVTFCIHSPQNLAIYKAVQDAIELVLEKSQATQN